MGRKRKIPKKIVVPTEAMVEELLKIYHTPEAFTWIIFDPFVPVLKPRLA